MKQIRQLLAELIGTALLVAIVVGSGIMAQQLTQDLLLTLLVNALATVFGLGVLIAVFLPVSGAQFNPAVSFALMLSGEQSPKRAIGFTLVQLVGGFLGLMLSHGLFNLELVQVSQNVRANPGVFLAEIVATAGLVFLIIQSVKLGKSLQLAILVPAWIGAGYFFTSSTSFANPAVTFARIFTESFTGIEWVSALWFVLAQILGMAIGVALAKFLVPENAQAKASGGGQVQTRFRSP